MNLSFLVFLKVYAKSEGIKFQQFKTVKEGDFKESYITQRSQNFIILIVLSLLLFIPFLGGKRKCLHTRSRYK